ncbi:hypothetical protein J7L70_02335 [Candidatus Bathyarchaeota archaeon]|nr:hypothetical protein [Candidatus Bathyarchaeota archaeon]
MSDKADRRYAMVKDLRSPTSPRIIGEKIVSRRIDVTEEAAGTKDARLSSKASPLESVRYSAL